MKKVSTLFLFVFFMLIEFNCYAEEKQIFFRENFNDLVNWVPIENESIDKPTTYSVISIDDNNNILKAQSDSSASALHYSGSFDVYKYPLITWRWKVDNIYEKGNAKTKEGDDYSIRVYVVFKFDPKKSGFFKNIKYKTAGFFYKGEIPDSALNYIWANKEFKEDVIINPYRKESMMILLQKGKKNVGKWITESVNIIDDYKKAFGGEPPKEASIIIMNDSDNTGEKAISYIDFIEVYSKKGTQINADIDDQKNMK